MKSRPNSQHSSRVGALALEKGWIDQTQLRQALTHQQDNNCKLGESLVALSYLSEKQLTKILRRQKWMRSFMTSLLVAATPMCPALASEAESDFKLVIADSQNEQNKWQDNVPKNTKVFSSEFAERTQWVYNSTRSLSNSSALQFGVTSNQSPLYGMSVVPEISVFTTSSEKGLTLNDNGLKEPPRSDRYKDTIPAVYRLTLKGYSVYENSENVSKYWAFEKSQDSPYKSYELMFSVTKRF